MKISVVMPVYNGEEHLAESIDSILSQTCGDFEFLIINEYGSSPEATGILENYAERDQRIRLIHNETKLGLAESLNKGFRMANGKYIARMDADDRSAPTRFEKEAAYLDAHPETSVCGSWQEHFGRYTDFHRPAENNDDLRAAFLFKCDVCHSTVMLRKTDFVGNNLFYDPQKAAEDYDLWLRAAFEYGLQFHTIPEILGYYRLSENSISEAKLEQLQQEGIQTAKEQLMRLGVHISHNDEILLAAWNMTVFGGNRNLLKRVERLFSVIVKKNRQCGQFKEKSLQKAIEMRREQVMCAFQQNIPQGRKEKIKRFLMGYPILYTAAWHIVQAEKRLFHN